MKIKTVSLKFQGQLKPRDYVVYPKSYSENTKLYFQSNNTCGVVDLETKVCLFNKKNARLQFLGMPQYTDKFTMKDEDIEALLDAQPQTGDTIGDGVVTIA